MIMKMKLDNWLRHSLVQNSWLFFGWKSLQLTFVEILGFGRKQNSKSRMFMFYYFQFTQIKWLKKPPLNIIYYQSKMSRKSYWWIINFHLSFPHIFFILHNSLVLLNQKIFFILTNTFTSFFLQDYFYLPKWYFKTAISTPMGRVAAWDIQ